MNPLFCPPHTARWLRRRQQQHNTPTQQRQKKKNAAELRGVRILPFKNRAPPMFLAFPGPRIEWV